MNRSAPLGPRELSGDAPRPGVVVGGRVTLALAGGFLLEHDAARIEVRWAQPAPLGAWVLATGDWTGRELACSALQVQALPARDLARADSDFSWGQRGGVAALRARHTALRAIRGFFDAAGFTEVDTPAVVRSPGLELHLDALEVLGAGEPRFLHTSPEYHMKRLLSAGMSRIYQLGKAFRRGELGHLHQPEFAMLEWYRAFSDSAQLMRDTEQLAAHVARAVHGSPVVHGLHGALDLTPPWERLTVREAFARYAARSVDELLPDEEAFYRVLVEQVEPQLGRGKPTFLTHYPASMAALARLHPDDPSCAERFEAYADGLELCNGFGELTDAAEQRRRFEADVAARKAQRRAVYPIDERFLDALADGLPECAGNALGVDRLLMLILGERSIDRVVAFAADRV